ncbi:similar to Saccharomyces cerevisiae YOR320C GNT1 N-acetylglucosaminyltransferase capable of modification of N-linked glycans in the Golgi apparatus [Maudiozyma barnettii]|uniref:Similar to Saccharomyces cerevisiae YOR320C GNT1 N-acetylglucosaminyltransferase capable of modification of N-linked glycans in the Golgi apparatus n=1 Tax=Maudiozyma barnettii TaxID=61262 RepID=A0A8H2VCD8_9SACH|nr:glucose N-acetyltransferase [Kazachstania barnettii]CAB4252653.1 similar to Saccharomyces cerevisiae YOR320C GNT1 N-acetylglucosaminyltransferase capable of modification of N-linked glycans in the Golgi apparatus [Kazachstania barnettii]CAD1780125.1 similar to Saccharomyces cerevisiae YOR320C GNT1 N-acetylglucosaminyltransferase capable of modification of N-linked glycans in the Golgi apparatus [Kazachstania barnettii]
MRILSKRRLRFLLTVIFAVSAVVIFVRCVVQFQLNKEIKYYKKYFKDRKDKLEGMYNPLEIKQIPSETIDRLYTDQLSRLEEQGKVVNWSKYAYINYVTDSAYLCNTLIIFDDLKNKFKTEAKLVLLISRDLLDPETSGDIEHIKYQLHKIQSLDENQVVIKYIENIVKPDDYTPWNESLTKLLVFNETDYDRIIYLDNDALLRNNLDELFFLPHYIRFAAPLTYWFLSEKDMKEAYKEVQHDDKNSINLKTYTKKLDLRIKNNKMIYNHLPSLPNYLFMNSKNVAQEIIHSTSSASPLFNFHINKKASKTKFASNLMVIRPSAELFNSIITEALPKVLSKKTKYDMDLINEEIYNFKKIIYYQFDLFRRMKSRFQPEVLVLPFARYGLLTGSIKNRQHHDLITNDILGYKRLDESGQQLETDVHTSIDDSKYIHFSDYPIGKPWNYASISEFECKVDEKHSKNIEQDTEACDLWNSVYTTYLDNRKICSP